MSISMFFAELIHDDDRPIERGVFLSLDEFEPYFKAGWRGASNTNAAMRKHMGEPVAQCSRAVADMIDPSRHLYMEGLIELID